MIKVTAKSWNLATRDWDALVEYMARDRMEAIRWIGFNRDWMKDFTIDGARYV